MAIGTVKWFNNAKGYGFILPDEGGADLFAHYSAIQMGGYKTLKAGQPVEFEITEGPKGLQATDIQAAAQEGFEDHDYEMEAAHSNGASASSEGAAATSENAVAAAENAVAAAENAAATSEVLSVTVEDAAPPQPATPTDHAEVGFKASHSS